MKWLLALAMLVAGSAPASAQSALDSVALMFGIVDGAEGSFRHTRRIGDGRFETLGHVLDSGELGRLQGRGPDHPDLEVIGFSEVTALGPCRYVIATRWLAPQETSEVITVDYTNFIGSKVIAYGSFAIIEFHGLDIQVKASEGGREREFALDTFSPGFQMEVIPTVVHAINSFRAKYCDGK